MMIFVMIFVMIFFQLNWAPDAPQSRSYQEYPAPTYLVSWHLTATLVGSCKSLTAFDEVATD